MLNILFYYINKWYCKCKWIKLYYFKSPFINKDCNQLLIIDTFNKSLLQEVIIDHNYNFHRIQKEDSLTNDAITTFYTNTFNCKINNFNSLMKKSDDRFLSLINKDYVKF